MSLGANTMVTLGSLKNEMESLKKAHGCGSYEYSDPSEKFTYCTTSHFREVKQKEKYGIYMISQHDTQEVLYIGKGGTIDSWGRFKKQDIPERLKAPKGGNIPADKWFRDLLQEKGPLLIEYVFLPRSKSPAFVEAVLLQAYLNEHHRLPYRNKSL